MYTFLEIAGKKVYSFEDHATALLPWAELSCVSSTKPYLITLDFHTDTHPAFLNHCFWNVSQDPDKAGPERDRLCKNLNKHDTISINNAISLLKHDEHIDAAIKSDIINHSFTIQRESSSTLSREEEDFFEMDFMYTFQNPRPRPPFTYSVPEDRMFVIGQTCAIGCPRGPHDDQCIIDHINQAIEDIYLQACLNEMTTMSVTSGLGALTERPYILDIDLDYFQTFRSVNPISSTVFHDLIRGALGITIAKESVCVEMGRKEETLDSSYLLNKVLDHIQVALCARQPFSKDVFSN
ncbi:hypothetical protein [Azospirillum largimobile]